MRVADEIMSNYQHVVQGITLTPRGGGVFDVVANADGETSTVYSKSVTGRHAHEGEVLAALEALLPAGTLRYGT